MNIVTIPKALMREKELILMPRKKYEEFLHLQNVLENRIVEEQDTDAAIAVYKKEKKRGKMKVIKSLAELD